METNPTRVCELVVGLGDVEVLGVVDEADGPLAVHVGTGRRPVCGGCGGAVCSEGAVPVGLVDLAAFGRPARLVWRKRRWRCPAAGCAVGSFTEVDEPVAPARAALTSRAGRWATVQVGRFGRPVEHVAGELGCDWHTVNDAVMAWGQALLDADAERVGDVSALGLDETLYKREGRWRTRRWCTSIVDVTGGQLLDVVGGRDAAAPTAWLEEQPSAWRDNITWGVLGLSGAYRSAFDNALPRAGQVADPFHVIRLANDAIDETRRRTHNDTLGRRGRRDDPLYRARRLLLAAHERLDGRGDAKLRGLLAAGDPRGEVRLAQHAKETLRGLATSTAPNSPTPTSPNSPTTSPTPTARPSCAASAAPSTAGTPTSSTGTTPASPTDPPKPSTTCVKRVKRVAYGFRRFAHYRIRALLYADKPNWTLLAGATPR